MSSPVKTADSDTDENYEPNVYFKPVVSLPIVDIITHEEDESPLLKLRAKLYRYDSQASPAEWKERGTGEVKLMHHKNNRTVRVVMRRDKTLKICANHFVTPALSLTKPSSGKKHWWIWTVPADFADEVPKPEIFAMKFASEQNAILWEEKVEEAKKLVQVKPKTNKDGGDGNSEDGSHSESEDSFEDALDKSHSCEEEQNVSKSLNKLSIKT